MGQVVNVQTGEQADRLGLRVGDQCVTRADAAVSWENELIDDQHKGPRSP